MQTQIYDVKDDVDWVNGAKVPTSRKVKLTDAEASYDLALGRISLAGKKIANAKPEKRQDPNPEAE